MVAFLTLSGGLFQSLHICSIFKTSSFFYKCHLFFSGIAAVLAVFILKIPTLDTLEIGQALEWVFFLLFPNFCYGNGLQDVYVNYEYRQQCIRQFDVYNLTRNQFCGAADLLNQSNPCCPS